MAYVFSPGISTSKVVSRSLSGWVTGCDSCRARLRLRRKKLLHERPRSVHIPQMQQGRSSNTPTSEDPVDISTNEDAFKYVNSEVLLSQSKEGKSQYTQRARLREETEAPFRKARMFVYAGSAISAGVGAFIALLRIIAALIGISGTQPLNETVPNVAINLGVVALCAFLLRTETKAGERRLERMSRGARIANLRVEDTVTRQVLPLKALRGRSRIVLIAGKGAKVLEAMDSAMEQKESLSKSNLLIVPFITNNEDSLTLTSKSWQMQPYGTGDWKKWFNGEVDVAKARLGPRADEILVVIIRLDGKVGGRSVGAPMWTRLVAEISRLPKRDQYGKP